MSQAVILRFRDKYYHMGLPITAASMFSGIKSGVKGFAGGLGEGFRGIGVGVVETVGDMGKRLTNTVTGLPSTLGEEIANIGDTVKGINIAPGFSLEDLHEQWKEPGFDDLTATLDKVTGININSMKAQFSSQQSVKARVAAYMSVIKRQVNDEVKACIEKYLRGLLNKNPWLEKLLDIQGAINYEIGKLQRQLRLDIEDKLEKLWYRKLNMHQIGDFKMDILDAIRKICPSHNSPPKVTRIPASLTRRLQTDISWKLPDGEQELIDIARTTGDASDIYNVERGGSTGEFLSEIVQEAVTDIQAKAEYQAIGYDTKKVSSFVNEDGTLV